MAGEKLAVSDASQGPMNVCIQQEGIPKGNPSLVKAREGFYELFVEYTDTPPDEAVSLRVRLQQSLLQLQDQKEEHAHPLDLHLEPKISHHFFYPAVLRALQPPPPPPTAPHPEPAAATAAIAAINPQKELPSDSLEEDFSLRASLQSEPQPEPHLEPDAAARLVPPAGAASSRAGTAAHAAARAGSARGLSPGSPSGRDGGAAAAATRSVVRVADVGCQLGASTRKLLLDSPLPPASISVVAVDLDRSYWQAGRKLFLDSPSLGNPRPSPHASTSSFPSSSATTSTSWSSSSYSVPVSALARGQEYTGRMGVAGESGGSTLEEASVSGSGSGSGTGSGSGPGRSSHAGAAERESERSQEERSGWRGERRCDMDEVAFIWDDVAAHDFLHRHPGLEGLFDFVHVGSLLARLRGGESMRALCNMRDMLRRNSCSGGSTAGGSGGGGGGGGGHRGGKVAGPGEATCAVPGGWGTSMRGARPQGLPGGGTMHVATASSFQRHELNQGPRHAEGRVQIGTYGTGALTAGQETRSGSPFLPLVAPSRSGLGFVAEAGAAAPEGPGTTRAEDIIDVISSAGNVPRGSALFGSCGGVQEEARGEEARAAGGYLTGVPRKTLAGSHTKSSLYHLLRHQVRFDEVLVREESEHDSLNESGVQLSYVCLMY